MLKIKFLGKTDSNFEVGKIYKLIKFEDKTHYNLGYFETWIIDKCNNIIYIPYSSIYTFNENWEVIDE